MGCSPKNVFISDGVGRSELGLIQILKTYLNIDGKNENVEEPPSKDDFHLEPIYLALIMS